MILIRLTLLGKVANDNADSFMEFYKRINNDTKLTNNEKCFEIAKNAKSISKNISLRHCGNEIEIICK